MSIVAFWAVGGSGLYWSDSVLEVGAILIALAAGFTFYWTVYTVAGQETGRSTWWYMFGLPRKGEGFWTRGREGWKVLLRIIDPRWWHRVATETNWPVRLVEVALVASLAGAVLSTALAPGAAPQR